ncbi:MAG: ABC transporter substrate-binding protein [Rhodospirillales bacterium]
MPTTDTSAIQHVTRMLQRLMTLLFVTGMIGVVAHIERAAAAEPDAFVQSMASRALTISSDDTRSDDQKVSELRAVFQDGFDVDYIGKYVLGRYWRQATEEERTAYLKIFEEYVVHSYAQRFSKFDGGSLKVGRSDKFQDAVHRVQSVFKGKDGQDVRLDWFVHETPAGLRAVDVVVEGISLRKTQRDEFMAVIRNGGGTVAGLIKDLRKLVDKLKTA